MNRRSSLVRLVQRVLLGVGSVILAYSGGTLAYATFYQRYQSWKLERKIDAPIFIPRATMSASVAAPVELGEGDPVGKLEIPEIGISVMVFQGVEEDTLRVGAGHVPGTPLPGGTGNSAIAGHRDTFFRKLEAIGAGKQILFSSERGTYEYVVDSTEIVEPDDTQVMESRGRPELTLITCYPFYFVGAAPHRFIVHAHPVESHPGG